MTGRAWSRGTVLAALVAAALAAVAAPPATAAPLYPDLATAVPTSLRLGTTTIGGQIHHVVRFTNQVYNRGEGPLELHGMPHFPNDGRFDATQWVYDIPGGVRQHPVGSFVYHEGHSHFHLDDFARYELWSRAGFEIAARRGFRRAHPLFSSEKVSFCVRDSEPAEPDAAPVPVYRSCSAFLEGLSVGWGDTYGWLLIDQWVDVGTAPLPDGEYVIRSIADPNNILFESEGKAAVEREGHLDNGATVAFTIAGGVLAP